MGGDSFSKGREFESWHHILDGNFFTYVVVVKFVVGVSKRGRSWHIFLKKNFYLLIFYY